MTSTPPLSRVVVSRVRPTTPDRCSDAKAVVGRPLQVSASVFADGHDQLAARLRWRPVGASRWTTLPMHFVVNDHWEGSVVPQTVGRHELIVEGWVDHHGTWRHHVTAKVDAGQDVEAELEEGARLIEADLDRVDAQHRPRLERAAAALRNRDGTVEGRLTEALAPDLAELLSSLPERAGPAASQVQRVWVDRPRAAVGAWYELFPRSYGGLRGAAQRLPAVADMGFDVVYLPPIHPIGTTARKGRGGSLERTADDPGSPWAIGSPEGGHDAVHPALGTIDDFDAFVDAAGAAGLDVALDYALQCSPDHPWVSQHPEWFVHRPDGTIRYAENPPKQYQDIYPLNFLPPDDEDRRALWAACRDVMEHWIGHGVSIFRVDNPHTKPFAFWQWLLADIRSRHPDVVFLAEAFTRPRVMERLAEIGFSQGYTYFTWRTSRVELEEYGEELAHGPASDYFRPNLWPNTPDILSGPLRHGGLGAFKMRAVLAATLGPSWGIYSGYELGENVPASDTNEEYAGSEKYEIIERDWDVPWSLAPYLTMLNRVRERHPAVTDLASLRFHPSTNDQLVVYSKQVDGDLVLVVVNLDTAWTQEATLQLDLESIGVGWDEPLVARDEVTGQTFPWLGANPYVRLSPDEPAHILELRRPSP